MRHTTKWHIERGNIDGPETTALPWYRYWESFFKWVMATLVLRFIQGLSWCLIRTDIWMQKNVNRRHRLRRELREMDSEVREALNRLFPL